jgi:cytochrome b561
MMVMPTFAYADPERPRPTAPDPAAAAPAASSPGSMSFDLMGDSKPAPTGDELGRQRALDRKVHLRRSLLQWHQALGFVTLGALAATCVIGQLNYDDKYGGGTDDHRYYNAHFGLGLATTAVFAVTGILALAAPNPYPKPIKWDTAFVHKFAMALATAGMVAQMVLGPIVAAREGKLDQRDWAMAHLVTGYATFGFMATGVIAYVF